MEHFDEAAMNLCLYGFLCIFGIQYMYGKSSSSSLVSIPNEVRTDLWLSSTSDAERSVRLYVGFPGNELSPSFLWQDADVMSLANKCIVVGCFVCGDYDKILMETGKFSDNIRVTENGLVSGVDRVLLCRRILRFRTSAIDLIHSERVSTSTSSFFAHRLFP